MEMMEKDTAVMNGTVEKTVNRTVAGPTETVEQMNAAETMAATDAADGAAEMTAADAAIGTDGAAETTAEVNETTERTMKFEKILLAPEPGAAGGKAGDVKLRVAAYCRVSSDSEEQLTSYEAQVRYYSQRIQAEPGWEFAGIYAEM